MAVIDRLDKKAALDFVSDRSGQGKLVATTPVIDEPENKPNDGEQSVESHPEQIDEPNEPPTYGERNRYLPGSTKERAESRS